MGLESLEIVPSTSPAVSCSSLTYFPGEGPFSLQSFSDHSVLAFLNLGQFSGQSSSEETLAFLYPGKSRWEWDHLSAVV